MLTTAAGCFDYDQDKQMLSALGLKIRPPFKGGRKEGAAVEAVAGTSS
jgi:hypothetical protein